MEIPIINWYQIGLFIGVFWGIFALFIYLPHPLRWKSKKAFDIGWSIVVILFQFFFNFVGGYLGCIGIGLFLDRYSTGHFGIPELILLAGAILGVSGKLSEIIFILPGTLKEKIRGN